MKNYKYIYLLIALASVSGCKIERAQVCQLTTNLAMKSACFKECLTIAGAARNSGGGDYTTNDDEDFHLVVNQCSRSCSYQSRIMVCGSKEERFNKAQKFNI